MCLHFSRNQKQKLLPLLIRPQVSVKEGCWLRRGTRVGVQSFSFSRGVVGFIVVIIIINNLNNNNQRFPGHFSTQMHAEKSTVRCDTIMGASVMESQCAGCHNFPVHLRTADKSKGQETLSAMQSSITTLAKLQGDEMAQQRSCV